VRSFLFIILSSIQSCWYWRTLGQVRLEWNGREILQDKRERGKAGKRTSTAAQDRSSLHIAQNKQIAIISNRACVAVRQVARRACAWVAAISPRFVLAAFSASPMARGERWHRCVRPRQFDNCLPHKERTPPMEKTRSSDLSVDRARRLRSWTVSYAPPLYVLQQRRRGAVG
jgi:hypothetical protein